MNEPLPTFTCNRCKAVIPLNPEGTITYHSCAPTSFEREKALMELDEAARKVKRIGPEPWVVYEMMLAYDKARPYLFPEKK